MRVQLTTSMASRRQSWNVGDVVDLSAKDARRLIDLGQAIPVRGRGVERAVAADAVETADK